MAATLQQQRIIDPYSSYESNSVNRYTRILTRGRNCIHSANDLDIIFDTTAGLILSVGQCYKDDVMIEVTASYAVDMTDPTLYVSPAGGMTENGYYYICLSYVYTKSKPSPIAYVKILKPSERGGYSPTTGNYLLLKVVRVHAGVGILSLHDYDPQILANHREFYHMYLGAEYSLPSYSQTRDQGRLVYAVDDGELYFGTATQWSSITASAGDKYLQIDDFDVDGAMVGIETSNVWNMVSTVRFSPFQNGGVWCNFRFKGNWVITTDINFEIMYTMSAQDAGHVSLNASVWIVNDGDIPNQAAPTVGPVEYELDPANVNVFDVLNLSATNIKVPHANLTTTNCLIIVKLWRDVAGVVANHPGWLEMIKLTAYQS